MRWKQLHGSKIQIIRSKEKVLANIIKQSAQYFLNGDSDEILIYV